MIQKVQYPTILVAPLNWGLGHATRCVPIIRFLERAGARVILASDGSALQLLKTEFPNLPAVQLPSYRIRYKTSSMVWNIAKQLPRILYAIRTEQLETERLIQQYGIHGILSDNRYGCFSKMIPSVMLTHQIHLKVPNAALQWGANQVLRRALGNFESIWIPDTMDSQNLSGALSHPPLNFIETKYLGLLSRFEPNSKSFKSEDSVSKVAIVLSGPEPQRTILEQILMEQALSLPQKFVFVKGKPSVVEHHIVAENVEVISYLNSTELNQLIQSSEVIVCRSGYSSLMDLAAIGGKKAILVPTPGQTEQEYLGALFAESGHFICQKQTEIDLKMALEAVEETRGFVSGAFDTSSFETVLAEWIGKLSPQA